MTDAINKARQLYNALGFQTWRPEPATKAIPCRCEGKGCSHCKGKGRFWTSHAQHILEAFHFEAHHPDCKALYIHIAPEDPDRAGEQRELITDLPMNEDHCLKIDMEYQPGGAWILRAHNESYGWRHFKSQKDGNKHRLDIEDILITMGAMEGRPKPKQATLTLKNPQSDEGG